MKKLYDYSLTWKLLLVPVVAALGFVAYLIYSSLVLTAENALLKNIRDSDFPTLEAARNNLSLHTDVVTALKTAAATGETEFLDVANDKAAEIRSNYEILEKLDAEHNIQIKELKSKFNAYFALAYEIAQLMATKKEQPDWKQLSEMRTARDAYLTGSKSYKDIAEKDFHNGVKEALTRSEHAQIWGMVIGVLMLLVIAVLTLLVTRGIVVLEKGMADKSKQLAEVNSDLEREIQKLKSSEEAKSHAEAVSQVKDEFLANMSHELRTPMNAIIGLSHLCLQTDMSLKQHDYLQKIHVSAKSLLGILNDILDISKIESGKMEMDRIPFELEEVMSNLATILGSKSQEKNLELLLETASDIPSMLIGDPLRLSQVLINLAGNSVKFTENGEVVVTAELEKVENEQVFLRFTVKDTGIGMSQSEIEKLFQPFTQADTSITRKFGGTGLGLTISKRIVEMMGGKIQVDSVPGKGSKFIFTACFRKAGRQFDHRLVALNDLRGLRIMVVDDCESSLQILRKYLESFSFEVTVANNGLDALRIAREASDNGKPFGLAILDWKMPQMNGIELAKKLKEMTGLRIKPKILLISAYGKNEMLQHIDTLVIDGILAKPFQQSKLFDAITRVAGHNSSATGRFRIGAQFNPELVSKINGARILLVEDNEINQQVAQELLENFGVTVTIAANGEEALATLKKERFDGMLMDIQMPVMDGISATREIRKNPDFAKLPIIALTANVMASEQNEFLAAGMNDHIGKPIDPDLLVSTLAKWVGGARVADSIQQKAPVSTQEALPDIPGVNVSESVRRIGGKVAIYYKLLDRFRVSERNIITRIREALAANDTKVAERLAHTLRGIAGTLGAEALQNQSEQLERNIKNGAEVEQLLSQIDQELAALITKIDLAFEVRQK